MAKRVVTLPDGRKLKVTAPDDADDEEVFAFALHSLILSETAAREKHEREIEGLTEGVRIFTSAMRDLTARLAKVEAWIARKAQERPPEKPHAPVVNVSPEVKVVSDPGIAAAIVELRKASDHNAKLIRDILDKLPGPAPASGAPKEWTFDVHHDTDPRSPRLGRMTRVTAKAD